MNIAQNLEQAKCLFPAKPALIFEDTFYTYNELDELSNRVANSLTDLGITRGERVALFLPNIPAFIFAYFGIQKIGAVCVAINSTLTAEETTFILRDSGATAIITTTSLNPVSVNQDLPDLRHILIANDPASDYKISDTISLNQLNQLMNHVSSNAQAVVMDPDEPAAILYTSGTTGFPKGATLSHDNVISNVRACVYTFRLQPDDKIILFLPAFHNFGQNAALLPCLSACGTLVLHREFELNAIIHSIVTHGITVFFGVPTIYRLLYEQASAADLKSIRLFISAAANLPLTLARQWQEKYGSVINEGYGLTENSLACFNHYLKYKPGSVGTPLDGIAVKVVDKEDNESAPGELGEIAIRGPNVMLGYWQRPAETAEVMRDGWFRTGDIGRLDDDGYLYIVDRVKDMINVGGLKVYPSEVENALYKHPAVAEAAVFGVQDTLLNEQVRASIVRKPQQTATSDDILAFCRRHLADYKIPGGIDFVDSLPKSRTGKILKRLLREACQTRVPVPELSGVDTAPANSVPTSVEPAAIEEWIIAWLARQLAQPAETIAPNVPFSDYGLTSRLAVLLAQDLEKWLRIPLEPVTLWKYPTVTTLTQHLATLLRPNTEAAPSTAASEMDESADLSTLSDAELADLLATELDAAKHPQSS